MACAKCGGTKWILDEVTQIKRVCTECKQVTSDENRNMAAVAICISTIPAAGNPSVEVVERMATN